LRKSKLNNQERLSYVGDLIRLGLHLPPRSHPEQKIGYGLS